VIVGGFFTTVGGVSASKVARYNPTTGVWSAIGGGVSGIQSFGGFGYSAVFAFAVLSGGDVIVGGVFPTAGGVSASNIARLNPTTGAWSALGSGVSNGDFDVVRALAALPGGDVIVGGRFDSAGGVAARNIVRYNPSTGVWSAIGGGSGINVNALAVLPGGDLVAGGEFTTVGGLPVNNITRWNGSAWSTLGTGITGGGSYPSVNALATLPNGDLIAGGAFYTAGGNPSAFFARYTFGNPADVAGPGQSPGSDNALTADDIIVYLNWFFAGDTRADVAGPGQSITPDTQFTADDIIVFLNRFFAGC
jgi:hypothetical protein